MILLQPLGMLALLGEAVILALYLTRPKFQRRQLTSTYLWRRSQRYLKEFRLSRKLIRYLLLALQLLIVALAALLLSGPRLAVSGGLREYVAILDTSASMLQRDEKGVSRFDAGRDAILRQIQSMGSRISVSVITTDSLNMLIERVDNAGEVERLLTEVTCGYGGADIDTALRAAQELLDAHPSSEVVFYTDHDFPNVQHLRVVNVAEGREEWNAAVTELRGSFSAGEAILTHQAVSYGRDAELTLALYVNDRLASARVVSCPADEPVEVIWRTAGGVSVHSARVLIDCQDGLVEDNEVCLYRPPRETLAVQLVSEKPFYWQTVLESFPQVNVTAVSNPELAQSEHFDLYIYDGVAPECLPQDGSVLLNAPQTLPRELELETGELLRGTYLSQPKRFINQDNRRLIVNVTASRIAAQTFREVTANNRYTPVLLCGEMPALLAGQRENGTLCLVLAFDLHASNLPLLPDFVALTANIVREVMPAMMDTYAYQAGETITAAVMPFFQRALLQAPDASSRELTVTDGQLRFSLQTPGSYTLVQERSLGSPKYCRFSVSVPERESDIRVVEDNRWLHLSPGQEETTALESDGLSDPTTVLALVMLLMLVLECVVYHRAYL